MNGFRYLDCGSLRLIVLAALCFFGGIAHADDKKLAQTHFEQGMKLYNLADYSGAEQEFRAGYLASPDPVFLFNIGQCARLRKSFDEALTFYRNYLRVRPDAPNRADVEGFIADVEKQLDNRIANKTPTAVAPLSGQNVRKTVPIVPETPSPEPAEAQPQKKKTWLWVTLGVAGAVVAGVGVGLGVGLTRGDGFPHTTYGTALDLH